MLSGMADILYLCGGELWRKTLVRRIHSSTSRLTTLRFARRLSLIRTCLVCSDNVSANVLANNLRTQTGRPPRFTTSARPLGPNYYDAGVSLVHSDDL